MKFLGLSAIWLLCYLGHAQSTEMAITEFSQKNKDAGILIDVRTSAEYEAGHLEDVLNIDWFAADFAARVDSLHIDRDKPVYLYCKMGGRSAKAAGVLDSLGYQNVVNLIGGYDAYRSKED